MKILAQQQWNYVLFETERGIILTYLPGGTAEADVSVLLTEEDELLVRSDPARVPAIVNRLRHLRDRYSGHQIVPPVWPT